MDGLDREGLSQIDFKPAAVATVLEKEVLGWIIRVAGDPAIVQDAGLSSISVALSIDEGEGRGSGGIVAGRWRHGIQPKAFVRRALGDPDLGGRGMGTGQD